jgi:hypothetical protein
VRTILILGAAASLAYAPALRAQPHDHAHPPAAPSLAASSPELAAQVQRVRQATARYRDIDAARRDGYRLFGAEGALMGEHWPASWRCAPPPPPS